MDFYDLASEEDQFSRAAGKRPRVSSPQKAVSMSPGGRGRKRRRIPQIMMADGKLLDLGGVVPGLVRVRVCVPGSCMQARARAEVRVRARV